MLNEERMMVSPRGDDGQTIYAITLLLAIWVIPMSPREARKLKELHMAWTTPVVTEICVGMEVTSYESAEI